MLSQRILTGAFVFFIPGSAVSFVFPNSFTLAEALKKNENYMIMDLTASQMMEVRTAMFDKMGNCEILQRVSI